MNYSKVGAALVLFFLGNQSSVLASSRAACAAFRTGRQYSSRAMALPAVGQTVEGVRSFSTMSRIKPSEDLAATLEDNEARIWNRKLDQRMQKSDNPLMNELKEDFSFAEKMANHPGISYETTLRYKKSMKDDAQDIERLAKGEPYSPRMVTIMKRRIAMYDTLIAEEEKPSPFLKAGREKWVQELEKSKRKEEPVLSGRDTFWSYLGYGPK